MKTITIHYRAIYRLLFILPLAIFLPMRPVSAQGFYSGDSDISITVIYPFVDQGPFFSISTPSSGLRVSNAVFTVEGTAEPSLDAVTNVYYSLNDSADFVPATTTEGWSTWSAVVNLVAGVNTVSAYAIDSLGLSSPTVTVQFVAVLSTELTVQTNGRGTLSPNDNGATFVVGQKYSITAAPAAGFAFTNWTAPGSVTLTNGRTLTFTMASNLVLTANFLDLVRPTLSLTTTSQQVSNSLFTVTGKAGDNVAVSNVLYSLNGSAWIPATTTNNWTNWSADVTLASGANTLQAYAVGIGGNLSSTGKIRVVYIPSASLLVQTNQPGWGFITPGYNGALLQIGKTYALSAKAGPGFVFTNWSRLTVFTTVQTNYTTLGQPILPPVTSTVISAVVFTNTAVLQFTMGVPTILASGNGESVLEQTGYQANFFDVQKPVVTILNPTANQMVASNSFVIRGKASDNAAVASVWYQFNGGGWLNPVGLTNWSVPVTLNPGTNTVMAYAMDTSGNVSPTNTVNFVCADKLPLGVNIFGRGTVSPNYNNDLLQVGQNYTMTAKPAAGFAFTNWSAVNFGMPTSIESQVKAVPADIIIVDPGPIISGPTPSIQVLTNNPTLAFSMTAGLDLAATFVDIAPPMVTITTPTPNSRVSNTVYTVTGRAADNVGVAAVYYQINGGGWQSASTGNGWTNWFTPSLNLLSETDNVVQVYAMDTSGNISATQMVTFVNLQVDPAPNSLAGTYCNGGSLPFYVFEFGTNTFSGWSYFSPVSGPPGVPDNVGDFTYVKISKNQGQLIISNTAPLAAVGGATVLDLTFSTQSSATFYDETIGGGGAISFYPLADIVPKTVADKKLMLIDNNQIESTLSLGNGTLTLTNGFGNPKSETYSFQPYSPIAGLLAIGDATNGTNYLIIGFLTVDSGTYYSSFYDASGKPQGTDSGEFVFLSEPSSPASLAGMEAEIEFNGDRMLMADFSARTYSQFDEAGYREFAEPVNSEFDESGFNDDYEPGTNSGVGTYTYEKKTGGTALLTLTATAPPTAVNGNMPVILTFLAPDFCLFVNQDDTNSVGVAHVFAATNVVPTSLAGHTIYADSEDYQNFSISAIDEITFTGMGTFTQVETSSSTAGTSAGTYTYTPCSPVGALIELKYSSTYEVGNINYFLATFSQTNSGFFNSTFYDNYSFETLYHIPAPPEPGVGPFSFY
jgi:hypothetical protein